MKKKKSRPKNRSVSSQRWIDEHENDEFVLKARKLGFRSRARFKLEEIDEKDKLLRTGLNVVDLGAAPGGWTEYVANRVGASGKVIALDILTMDPVPGVVCLQADFTEDEALGKLETALGGAGQVDLVLSDMAPNISGIKAVDQPKAMYLVELAVDLAQKVLANNGDLLVKVFHGEGFEEILQQVRGMFNKVIIRKPQASRSRSTEVYILARGYKGN